MSSSSSSNSNIFIPSDVDQDTVSFNSSFTPLFAVDPIPLAMESIKNMHFQKSTRDLVAMSDLETIHAFNFKNVSNIMVDLSKRAYKYDSIIFSARYSVSSFASYRSLANIIAYIFEFNWSLISTAITFALTAAINPRVVFMQSSALGEIIKSSAHFVTILRQVFYYKGMLDYSLLSAFGLVLLETNMFSKIERVKEYQSIIEAKSVLSADINKFEDGSRAKETISLLKTLIDKKMIISLTMIVNGFLNVTMDRPLSESVFAAKLGLSTLASVNFQATSVILTCSQLDDDSIIMINKTKPADEQLQIDNITRAIEGRNTITRDMNLADVEFLVKICYTTKY